MCWKLSEDARKAVYHAQEAVGSGRTQLELGDLLAGIDKIKSSPGARL